MVMGPAPLSRTQLVIRREAYSRLVTVTWTGRHRTLVVAKCSQREHEAEIPF